MLNAIFRRLFADSDTSSSPADVNATAARVYGSIVAQARQPVFYADLGVPDTPTGRFEMIVAHAVLVFRKLRGTPDLEAAGQAVFDLFFADMDRSLRELGVGDLSVPKQIKKMGQAFYGHAGAYSQALDAADAAALAIAVRGNVLATAQEAPDLDAKAQAIAAYMIACEAALRAQEAADVLAGKINWPGLAQPQEARA